MTWGRTAATIVTMIEFHSLTKRYGSTVAVDDLTASVPAGAVTGFLGPNGAGKSTTMRLAVGLDAPTTGAVHLDGRPYASFQHPLRVVGTLLDAGAIDGSRSAIDHLGWLARSQRIDRGRVTTILDMVGLADGADRRIRTFSLGMQQRLGIAAALLGDPRILVLDEPMNGLDPEGIRWIRALLRALAAEGRTVLVSSHLIAEMAITADRLLILSQGRLVADTTVTALAGGDPAAPGGSVSEALEVAYLRLTGTGSAAGAGSTARPGSTARREDAR